MITCTFEDGTPVSLRHAVVDTIIEKDNMVLLVKRSPTLHVEPGKWCTPGGFVDRGETLSEAATREVREETGYTISDLHLFRINSSPNRPHESERQSIDCVFLARAGEKESTPDWEVTETRWFSLDELPEKKDVAFDHYDNLMLFKKWREEKFALPLLS